MHEQIFISEVWWSGAYYIADIASVNGYDLGRKLNSRNDNVFAWKTGPFYSMDCNYSPGSIQDILETKWPFNEVTQEDSDSFRSRIIQSRSPHGPEYNCCKLSTFCLMTPLINSAFVDAPIINVIRNPIDVSLYESDNYFLRFLIQDKLVRHRNATDGGDLIDAVGYLFTALGDLRWKVNPTSENGWTVISRFRPVLWNLLYVLRWALIQDRLEVDTQNHKIKNIHNITFEKIVTDDKEEVERLQDILKISGTLKMPKAPVSEVFKYKTNILPALESENESVVSGAENILKIIYLVCKPYLEKYEYTQTIEIFEQIKGIK